MKEKSINLINNEEFTEELYLPIRINAFPKIIVIMRDVTANI